LAAPACRLGCIAFQPPWWRWNHALGLLDHGQQQLMQVPVGYVMQNGQFVSERLVQNQLEPGAVGAIPHMVLAAYLTGAFCVAATGAWYLLRGVFAAEARLMLRMGLYFAAGCCRSRASSDTSTATTSMSIAGQSRALRAWHTEQPASEVLIGIPVRGGRDHHYAISIPILGSLIAA